MFKKILHYFSNFLIFFFTFNPIIAIKLFIIPILTLNKPIYERNTYKHKVIKRFLKRKYWKILRSYKEKSYSVDPSFADSYPIWFLRWDGKDSMPPIVKACYESIIKNSNGHKVILLTKDNLNQYISLPDYIFKKIESGKLSITHLSDIIRLSLLYEHGGLWLDSTVFLSSPLPPLPEISKHLGFWTPKDNGEIITSCFGASNWIIRDGMWLSFCMYSSKNNILPLIVKTLYLEYVKRFNTFIDYFIIDYFLAITYDTIPLARILIDSVPINNPKVHEFHHRLQPSFEFNEKLFNEICTNTFIHKLNWKEEYQTHTKNGKLTNYGYILDIK